MGLTDRKEFVLESFVSLLDFMNDLMSAQCFDSRWISSDGVESSCDVSEVVGWFYQILLPDLLRRKDVDGYERYFVELLAKELTS